MIYVIDRTSIGDTHIVYNSSVLAMLSEIVNPAQIIFIADNEHSRLVKERLPEKLKLTITFRNCLIFRPKGNPFLKILGFIRKRSIENIFLQSLFREVAEVEGDIFVCSIPPIMFNTLIKVARKFPDVTLTLTMHGELEHIQHYNNLREQQIGRFYLRLFKTFSSNIHLLFLNKIAKSAVEPIIKASIKQSIEINHPYVFKIEEDASRSISEIPVFGNIGSLGSRKSGQLLFKVAELCADLIINNKLKIVTVGLIEDDIDSFRNDLVIDYLPNNKSSKYLDRAIFDKEAKNVDYALYFFNSEQFIFRASGALFDAINFKKPLIAIRHPFFNWLFDTAGNIGFIVDNIDDMAKLLHDIAINREVYQMQYNIQLKNLNALLDKLSIEHVAKDFNTQFQALKRYSN